MEKTKEVEKEETHEEQVRDSYKMLNKKFGAKIDIEKLMKDMQDAKKLASEGDPEVLLKMLDTANE